jgi:hypothetical protein
VVVVEVVFQVLLQQSAKLILEVEVEVVIQVLLVLLVVQES